MDVNNLLIFVRVVQAGSFSKAARLLSMPKSTVSRRIADLEEDLGVPLIHRTTRSLRVTDVGAGYLEHGLKIAAEIERADSLLTSLQSVPQGRLRVTAATDFGNQFLGKITRDFLRANKKVSVDLVLTERIVDLIGEGFDVAIRIGDLEDSSLMARKIGQIHMQLYASPNYLSANGEPKTPEDLKKHQCILFTGEEDSPRWELQSGKSVAKIAVTGRATSNNMAIVHDLALQGEGVAMLPYFLCVEDVKKGKLRPVLKDWTHVSGPIHAVFPGQRFMMPKVRAFVEHLSREFKDYRWHA